MLGNVLIININSMKNSKLFWLSTLNSLGVAIYVFLVVLFLNNAENIFGPQDNKILAPMLFLLLFIFSALLTGFLVLGRPIMLYLNGLKKEGLKALLYTGNGLLLILIIVFIIFLIIK